MELKELVESTLKQLDEKIVKDDLNIEFLEKELEIQDKIESQETIFLMNLKERLVVLFEGLMDDELKDKEAKLELTLNFLEYTLALIEDKLDGKDG